jgi:hypothetical protein
MKTKSLVTLLIVSLLIPLAQAQEKAPPEEARKIAGQLAEHQFTIENPQVEIKADSEKAALLKADGIGVLIILDKNLSAKSFENIDKEMVPVAQMWSLKVVPAADGKATPDAKLRIISLDTDDKHYKLPLCLLGARKKADKLELVVFGKDKEPLLTLPLTKSGSGSGEVDISGEKKSEDSGELTFTFPGKYQAKLGVMKQAE